MSASISPTRWPARASATATLADTVDLPTPPLPDEMAITLPRWQIDGGRRGRHAPRRGTRCPGRGSARRGARVGHVHPYRGHPRHALHRFANLAGERARIVAAQEKRERDDAILLHGQVLDHGPRENVGPAARILELREGALDARLKRVGSGHA